MRSSEEDITMLDDYIKGRLDDEAKSALELRLATDQDLRADLEDLKVLQQGMRARALTGKLDMIREWEEEVGGKEKTNGNWKKWMIMIFFISVLGYLLYYFTLKSASGLPEEYKSLYAAEFDKNLVLHSTKRSVTQVDKLSAEQRRAFDLYRIQLFDDAIPLLDALWSTKKDTLALFYLGVSQIGVGEKEKGLMIFKKPELNNYSKQTNLFFNY